KITERRDLSAICEAPQQIIRTQIERDDLVGPLRAVCVRRRKEREHTEQHESQGPEDPASRFVPGGLNPQSHLPSENETRVYQRCARPANGVRHKVASAAAEYV